MTVEDALREGEAYLLATQLHYTLLVASVRTTDSSLGEEVLSPTCSWRNFLRAPKVWLLPRKGALLAEVPVTTTPPTGGSLLPRRPRRPRRDRKGLWACPATESSVSASTSFATMSVTCTTLEAVEDLVMAKTTQVAVSSLLWVVVNSASTWRDLTQLWCSWVSNRSRSASSTAATFLVRNWWWRTRSFTDCTKALKVYRSRLTGNRSLYAICTKRLTVVACSCREVCGSHRNSCKQTRASTAEMPNRVCSAANMLLTSGPNP